MKIREAEGHALGVAIATPCRRHPLEAWADPAAVRWLGYNGRRLLACFFSVGPLLLIFVILS